VKIGQHLAKLEAKIEWFHLFQDTVYNYVPGIDYTRKFVWRCDNVGGLREHVTCHIFWFLTIPFLIFFSRGAAQRAMSVEILSGLVFGITKILQLILTLFSIQIFS